MNIKKIIAGAVLAGGLTFGAAGIAAATDTAPTTAPNAPQRPTPEQLCQKAKTAWDRLKSLDERLHAHYQKLQELRQRAVDAGKTDLVARIDARIELVKDRHQKVVNRMKEIHDKLQGRCDIPEADDAAL